MTVDNNFLRQLRLTICQHFDLTELESVAFDLALNWDELAGITLSAKCQSLIGAMQRNGRLPELLHLLRQERSHVIWPDLPTATTTSPPKKEDAMRTAVWNALYESLWTKKTFLKPFMKQVPLVDKFSQRLWVDYFNKPIDARPQEPEQILQEIRETFFTCDNDEFYRYLLFILNYWNGLNHYKPEIINQAVNKALVRTGTDLQYVAEYHFGRYFESGSLQPIQIDKNTDSVL